ncbi:hypothetical protein [Flavobacterium aquidurense]|uniref:Uncharacterized protein n=1 Tax=Flavobacterium aquidurense TaxID=362413 RepID=A0A0Q1BNF2_9FLAO|nr:hypothetical protein [Flavobacterium aquidurense]KQB42344.1 hypothetical protein RC62_3350 [Flavobacterium aquidurense]
MRSKQNLKKIERRKLKNKEKKINQRHYILLIMAMIFAIINHTFFESATIGHNIRYNIYVFFLPISIGILFFGIYRKDFLIRTYLSFTKTYEKIYVILFYLLQGIIVSYLSFEQIASVTWNYINTREAEKNLVEIINCKVEGFYTRKNPDISFKFQNRTEVFSVSQEMNRQNYNRNPKDYSLEITIQKGIWNYYVVKHWELKSIR